MKGKKFTVIGMGKYGKSIATFLSDRNAEVIAVDNREEMIDDVVDDVALAVTLDATDIKALQSQNIQVSSMRNKSNRLEELFVKMVEKNLEGEAK